MKYYVIRLTGGTSPGPYTIYYGQSSGSENIAFYSGTTQQAIDIPYSDLYPPPKGVIVEVPDDTTILYLYNQLCGTKQPLIPQVITEYNDFCFTYNNKSYPFTQTGFDDDGIPIWSYDNNESCTISFNSTLTPPVWVMNQSNIIGLSNNSGNNLYVYSQSTFNANPPNNWVVAGGQIPYNIIISETCAGLRSSSFPVSINQPSCSCDGSIIFNVDLDNPPYSYSINNGVTYSKSPIFTKLCSGIYVLSVVNSLGDTFSKTITLDKPTVSTTYTLSLTTTTSTPVINEISLVNNYETTINVSPTLPDGTTITFDLIHTNSFYSSPTSGTSVLTTGTVLSKNLSAVTLNSVVTGNTQSVNTTPGCQNQTIYQSNINEVWNSITMTNSDTITISTTSRVDKKTTGLCVVGYSDDTYSIVNVTINGCDCCSVIVNT